MHPFTLPRPDVLVLAFLMGLWACSDGAQNQPLVPEDEAEPIVEPVDMTPPAYDPQDPRTWNRDTGAGASAVSPVSRDLSQYAVQLRDSYGDHFYLDPVPPLNSTVPAGYRGYHGVFVSSGVEFPTAVVYDANTETLAASLDYTNDQNMVYNATLATTNYFVGTYAWTRANYEYMYKLRRIAVVVEKGEL